MHPENIIKESELSNPLSISTRRATYNMSCVHVPFKGTIRQNATTWAAYLRQDVCTIVLRNLHDCSVSHILWPELRCIYNMCLGRWCRLSSNCSSIEENTTLLFISFACWNLRAGSCHLLGQTTITTIIRSVAKEVIVSFLCVLHHFSQNNTFLREENTTLLFICFEWKSKKFRFFRLFHRNNLVRGTTLNFVQFFVFFVWYSLVFVSIRWKPPFLSFSSQNAIGKGRFFEISHFRMHSS
jgi:hypothetical protein